MLPLAARLLLLQSPKTTESDSHSRRMAELVDSVSYSKIAARNVWLHRSDRPFAGSSHSRLQRIAGEVRNMKALVRQAAKTMQIEPRVWFLVSFKFQCKMVSPRKQ